MNKLALSIAVAGVLSGAAAPALAAGTTVGVSDNHFAGKVVHVSRGATVTWKWSGHASHNVTFNGFHSRTIQHGTYSHRFATSGTFQYVCTLHDRLGMVGTIVVG